MIALVQLVNRMISLGYTKEGVTHYLNLVRDGKISAPALFIAMGYEEPSFSVIERFHGALRKADSVIHISFQEET